MIAGVGARYHLHDSFSRFIVRLLFTIDWVILLFMILAHSWLNSLQLSWARHELHESLSLSSIDLHSSPRGAQEEPKRSPKGAQKEPKRTPRGPQVKPNRFLECLTDTLKVSLVGKETSVIFWFLHNANRLVVSIQNSNKRNPCVLLKLVRQHKLEVYAPGVIGAWVGPFLELGRILA